MFLRRPGGLPYPQANLSGLEAASPPIPAAPLVEPVLWKNKSQGGALDLTVNVAILAIAAAATVQIGRAPLYITAPTKKWTQIEQPTNVAATAARIIREQIEPTFYRRNAPQVELFPNLAVRLQTARPDGTLIDPPLWVPRPLQPDVLPNLAVNLQAARPAGTLVDPVTWKPRYQQDVLPNIAVNLQTARQAGSLIEPVLWKPGLQINPVRNRAIYAFAPTVVIPPPLEPQFWKSRTQVDVFPNLAINGTEVTPLGRSRFLVNAPWKRWTPVEQVPNLAALVQPASYVVSDFQSLPSGKWAPVELYPNLAALATPPIVLISPTPEPTLTKRLPPQIEVFQNTAAMATPAAPVLMIPSPEPTYTRKGWTQPEIFPNIAIRAPLSVVVLLHQVNMGVSFGVGLGRMGYS